MWNGACKSSRNCRFIIVVNVAAVNKQITIRISFYLIPKNVFLAKFVKRHSVS